MSDHRPAVILANLGTPEQPTPKAVRKYLREFLSDRRIIEMSPLLWRPILELAILPVRGKASAHKYQMVWTDQGSPLMVYSKAQVAAVQEALGDEATVHLAMRYGEPALEKVVKEISATGTNRILLVPLYPQYSATSAGTVHDELARVIRTMRNIPEIRWIRSFETDPQYIDALAHALRSHWETAGTPDAARGERVVLSYHSIPKKGVDDGDPYPAECEATTAAVAQALGQPKELFLTTYQSKFGPAEWVGPQTIDTVTKLGGEGCPRVDVICPGFVSDCLETLEEIELLNREAYTTAGGGQFHYVPWGNAAKEWTDALGSLVRAHLAGWL